MGTSNLKDHLVDKTQLDTMVKTYDSKNYAAINANRIKPDSKEYVFPIELVEDYLTFVRDEAKKKGYTNLRISVKMGQYPEQTLLSPIQDPETKGYQTICFTAKYDSGSGVSDSAKNDEGIPGMNFGTICPPRIP